MFSCFDNVLVVDLSRVLAGPMAAQHLGDLGAEVIKIERKGAGDDSRNFGPPFLKDTRGCDTRQSPMYLSANRNKKSLEIDFQSQEDLAFVKHLLAQADVVIENYKVGDLARYGLDYECVKRTNANVVYCSITGYGQTGPYKDRPGYDSVFQAESGLMSVTGNPDGFPGDGPMKVGPSIADIITGLYAANAIGAALYKREHTREGAYVEVALMESMISGLGHFATQYLTTGVVPKRLGSQGNGGVPAQVFHCQGGAVMMTAGNQRQYVHFCEAIERLDLIEHPLFATNTLRVQNRWKLCEILETHLQSWDAKTLLHKLQAHNVPAGMVNTLEEVFNDPHVRERGVVQTLQHPHYGEVALVKNPINIPTMVCHPDAAPPEIGEHNAEISQRFSN